MPARGLPRAALRALPCARSPPSDAPPPAPSTIPSATPIAAPPWPELPRTREAANVLVNERTQRDHNVTTGPPLDADTRRALTSIERAPRR